MSLIIPANSASAAGGYAVDNSLRFNGGSSDYLNRTNATPTNQLIWTYSFWVKLSDITNAQGSGNQLLLSDYSSSSNRGTIFFEADDTLVVADRVSNSNVLNYTTTRLFRDVSAWYHIVINHNRTLSTPVTKIFVNGVQETAFNTSTNPSQNGTSYFNVNGQSSLVGKYGGGSEYYNGYLAEAVWIDGQALDADQFGEFDEDSGIWKPIDVSGLTFGNNGFYLDFENSGALGADVSGNTNNFTVTNLTATDQSTDTCTTNFATLNAIAFDDAGDRLSEGNLRLDGTSASAHSLGIGTIAVNQGKWWFEAEIDAIGGTYPQIGVRSVDVNNTVGSYVGQITGGAGYLGSILSRELLDLGYNVTVYDNLMYKQLSLVDVCHYPNFEFVMGDVRDKESLLSYIKNSDVIFPLAAIVGFPACDKDKKLATEVNYEQIKFIVENLRDDQKIIYPNSNSGYGIGEDGIHCTEESPLNPVSHYGKTKVDAESIIVDSGNGITLRLATVFGTSPRMRLDLLVNEFVYKAITDTYITVFEKDFKRNYIHIQDVISAFVFMLENYEKYNGEMFNVGLSDSNLNKEELVYKIKKFIPHFDINFSDFYSDPDKRDYIVSNDKIEATGWSPKYSLDDGIRELIKAYKIIINNDYSRFRNT